jgi:Glycosyl transferases group 1
VKILLAHPGAIVSVGDVYDGLAQALTRRSDVELIHHELGGRMYICELALNIAWKKVGKAQGLPKPSDVDVIYFASQGILEKALRFQPDWTVLVTGHYFIPEFVRMLKRCPTKVAFLLTESPYEDEIEKLRVALADLAWTNERTSVGFLGQFCDHVHYLPHAYNPARQIVRPERGVDGKGKPTLIHHERGKQFVMSDDLASHDVVFVGTLFEERIKLLEAVDWDGIDFGIYGCLDLLGSRHHLRKYVRGGITPNWMAAELYRRAKIGLSLFRTSIGFGRNRPHIQYAESMGPRSLELAASGCFHISEYRKEVDEVFGGAVPTFDGPKELESLVRSYLMEPYIRATHAATAKQLALPRSFDAMAAQVVADLTAAS